MIDDSVDLPAVAAYAKMDSPPCRTGSNAWDAYHVGFCCGIMARRPVSNTRDRRSRWFRRGRRDGRALLADMRRMAGL
jgi:hypothetical protein